MRDRLLVAAALAVFFCATLVPIRVLDPFARTEAEYLPAGGVRLRAPGLLASAPAPPPLETAAFREGRFTVEITCTPDRAPPPATVPIVAYARSRFVHDWMIGQKRDDLIVRHRGGRARFDARLRRGRSARLVVHFEGGRARVESEGRAPETLHLYDEAAPWDGRGRLVLGNVPTGERPWTGTIEALRIRPEGAPALALRGPEVGDVAVPPVAWPWRHKLAEILRGDYAEREGDLRDVLLNVALTLPLGFALARLGWRLAAVLATQAGLSLAVETLQFFSTRRTGDWVDLTTNVAGALLGAVAARALRARRAGARTPRSAPRG